MKRSTYDCTGVIDTTAITARKRRIIVDGAIANHRYFGLRDVINEDADAAHTARRINHIAGNRAAIEIDHAVIIGDSRAAAVAVEDVIGNRAEIDLHRTAIRIDTIGIEKCATIARGDVSRQRAVVKDQYCRRWNRRIDACAIRRISVADRQIAELNPIARDVEDPECGCTIDRHAGRTAINDDTDGHASISNTTCHHRALSL